MTGKIKGILFDSGNTLVTPEGGKWFPGLHFKKILKQHKITGLQWKNMEDALWKGMDYLEANHKIKTLKAEHKQFVEYYKILLKILGMKRIV